MLFPHVLYADGADFLIGSMRVGSRVACAKTLLRRGETDEKANRVWCEANEVAVPVPPTVLLVAWTRGWSVACDAVTAYRDDVGCR